MWSIHVIVRLNCWRFINISFTVFIRQQQSEHFLDVSGEETETNRFLLQTLKKLWLVLPHTYIALWTVIY